MNPTGDLFGGIVANVMRRSTSEPGATAMITERLDNKEAEIAEILRPCLLEPSDEIRLVHRIDAALYDDDLFDRFIQVPLASLQRALTNTQTLLVLESLVADFMAQRVALTLAESMKAIFLLITGPRVGAEQAAEIRSQLGFDPDALFRPSRYIGCRTLPPAVLNALLGRDIANIALTGLVHAREWGISATRAMELCDLYCRHQSRWLEFLALAPNINLAEEVLPEQRTNFAGLGKMSDEANTPIDRAFELLDKENESAYLLFCRAEADEPDGT